MAEKISPRGSSLFQPFRAIGYVTADSSLNVQIRGNTHALTTSVGNSFHIYDGEKLNLLFTGPQSEHAVTAVAAHRDRIYSATGGAVSVAERGKEVARWVVPGATTTTTTQNLTMSSLIVFGTLLLALCNDNTVRIWDRTTGEYHNEITFPETFRVTTAVHPSTYLNKILFASQQGTLQLWNIRTLRMLYEFPSLGSPITVMTQAPAVDVIAIGLLDGSIILHNIRADVEIMRLKQEGKVTAISFRTDERSHMATGSISGDLAVWDLTKQQILNVLKGAHAAPIHTAYYFAGQPILITAGNDNAIRQWIFDSAEGVPRLLRSRGGHTAPPTRIRYHPLDSSQIISAGNDEAVRVFSVARDSNCMEIPLGEKKNKGFRLDDSKIAPVTQIAAAEDKTSGGVNIITSHIKDPVARICSYGGKPLTKRTFSCTDGSLVKAVAISACAHFGFVGSAQGCLDRYNLQSGLLRKTYGGRSGGHTKAIVGIVSDRVNRLVITAALDGLVKFWSFQSGSLLHTIVIPSPITALELHRESGLITVTADDFAIRVIDTATRKIVREFVGHRSQITDTAFTPDGRLLISTSTDATMRTWDLPTGHCVDVARVASIPRSVCVSPSGDYIATVHADQVGVFLWVNRLQFGQVALKRVDEDKVDASAVVELPKTGGLVVTEEDERIAEQEAQEAKDEREREEREEAEASARAAADGSGEGDVTMICTSATATRTKWQNLLSLDALRKRNQPAEAPKSTGAAFFLPSLRDQKKALDAAPAPEETPKSRILNTRIGDDATAPDASLFSTPHSQDFIRLLRSCSNHDGDDDDDDQMADDHEDSEPRTRTADYAPVSERLLELPPSQIDVLVRTLGEEDLALFVDALLWMVESRREFEAVQALLALVIKVWQRS
ncbi:hypothetical protein HKX48_000877 [Thoreauomyces humboldtii]|nr:hypothetical protein HKX48_000877 [Thoreauomyces humboldtii]